MFALSYLEKLNLLEKWFKEKTKNVVVAFSGGVDSSLVVFLAKKYLGKANVLAIISSSPSLKQKDLNVAVDFCNLFEINLEIIETKEIEDSRYTSNPINRCYFCKFNLYDELQNISIKYPNTIILDGQNSEDLSDYRPGIKAAEEFNIYHPLADCGLSKNEIREIARHFNLPTWDKPASPCLSSRIPYGQEVTIEKLKQIETAENILNKHGFNDVRVRHYNNHAVIEVPPDRLPDLVKIQTEISQEILKLGFDDLKIDEEGLISGKLNRALV
jgi:pyridinium-3,5-biscarboxylic acid mononucleotide sulfurtransferase